MVNKWTVEYLRMGGRLVSILLTMTDGEANLGEQVGKHEAE